MLIKLEIEKDGYIYFIDGKPFGHYSIEKNINWVDRALSSLKDRINKHAKTI